MDEITLDGKKYVSSKRAATISGYAKDYIGQLCREGKVEARQVGRNWYVVESSLREHRFGVKEDTEKSAIAEMISPSEVRISPASLEPAPTAWKAPTYSSDSSLLMPQMGEKKPSINEFNREAPTYGTFSMPASSVPSTPPQHMPLDAIRPAASTVPVSSEVIAEMQSAWQDWFKSKNDALPAPAEELLLESPEILDARQHEAVDTAYPAPLSLERVTQVIDEQGASIRTDRESSFDGVEQVVQLHRDTTSAAHIQPLQGPLEPIHMDIRPLSAATPHIASQTSSFANTGSIQRTERSLIGTREGSAHTKKSQQKMPKGRIVSEKRVHIAKPSVVLQSVFVALSLISIAIAVIGTGNGGSLAGTLQSRLPAIHYITGETTLNK